MSEKKPVVTLHTRPGQTTLANGTGFRRASRVALTSAIEELVTVEVREDVAVALLEASSAVERTAVAATIGTALAGAGARAIGMFADGATFGVAIERWRRDELSAALRTATSLSR